MDDKISMLSINALKPHPKNAEFFDDASGEAFEKLKDSISHLGVLTPLRVASDMTIISGHQRWRACKELGLTQVPVIIAEGLEDEDDKEMQLIASNFGRMKNDPVKQARLIQEYERLAGVKVGNPGKLRNNFAIKTQADIAKELGVTPKTLQNLKKLNDLDPEIQELISVGKLTPTTGFTLIAKLSPAEQTELVKSLGNLDATKAEIERRVKLKVAAQNAQAAANGAAEETQYKDQAAALEKQVKELQAKLVEDVNAAKANSLVEIGKLSEEKKQAILEKNEAEEKLLDAGVAKEMAEQKLELAEKKCDELQAQVDSHERVTAKIREQEREKLSKEYQEKLKEMGIQKFERFDDLPDVEQSEIERIVEMFQELHGMIFTLPTLTNQMLSDMRLYSKEEIRHLIERASWLYDYCGQLMGALSTMVKDVLHDGKAFDNRT